MDKLLARDRPLDLPMSSRLLGLALPQPLSEGVRLAGVRTRAARSAAWCTVVGAWRCRKAVSPSMRMQLPRNGPTMISLDHDDPIEGIRGSACLRRSGGALQERSGFVGGS